jgi:tRNA (adenine-N(1)-)-methyltransferase non-catalytic subunit
MIIKDGDYVLIQLPSSNRKLVKVKADQSIELGKFGCFKAHLLIGKRYEQTFAIQGEEIIEKELQLDIELEEKEGSNENIIDFEGNQKLTFEEIEKMKILASGTEIVQSIIENHADFDKKTTFAKFKYLKRKSSKFIKGFTAQKITARRLLEYFSEKNLQRVKEIRIDTLSQIITLLNTRAGCKYLTVDDTNGIIVAAILERLQGYGQVYNMSEHENGKLDAPKYLNYSPQVLNYIMYPWNRIDKQQDELVDLEELKKDDSEMGVKKFARISNKFDIIKSKRAEFLKADFDG